LRSGNTCSDTRLNTKQGGAGSVLFCSFSNSSEFAIGDFNCEGFAKSFSSSWLYFNCPVQKNEMPANIDNPLISGIV
jgi:hypothetical protein